MSNEESLQIISAAFRRLGVIAPGEIPGVAEIASAQYELAALVANLHAELADRLRVSPNPVRMGRPWQPEEGDSVTNGSESGVVISADWIMRTAIVRFPDWRTERLPFEALERDVPRR